MSDGLLTYQDLAQQLGVSARQAKRIARKIDLKVLDLGARTVRIRPADLARALERLADVRRYQPRRRRAKA